MILTRFRAVYNKRTRQPRGVVGGSNVQVTGVANCLLVFNSGRMNLPNFIAT